MASPVLEPPVAGITWRGPRSGSFMRPWSVRASGPRCAADEIKNLVLRARDGESEAFGALYDHYFGVVYRYVYGRVGVHALAEDLTSDTFLRALRRIGDFNWQGRDFGAWLVTIARNLIADHFKSSRHRLEICAAEPPDTGRHVESAERAMLDQVTSRTLLAAIRRLGAEQRECVVLRFLYGLSVAETADVMRKKSGAVKALQHRAVRSLAKMLPQDLRS
jgi:RNA polymerase sigma-70 factor (TIGR02952 family)